MLEAGDGEQALALAAAENTLDMVLTDVVMAGMSGPEMASRLHATRPELPVVYMSGYDRELIDRTSLQGIASLLPKPFTPGTLLAKVAEVLAEAPRREGRGKESAAG